MSKRAREKSTTVVGAGGLIGKLRELGLTEYEAKVYLTLLEEGPLKPSEIAVKAGVPRTKVYEAVRSLERKGFAKTHGKPRVCIALDAEDILKDMIEEEEKRVQGLRSALDEMARIRARRLGISGEAEGRYNIVSGRAAVDRLKQLALSARRSFHGVVDSWGLELLAESRYELGLLPLNGVDIKVVVSSVDAEALESTDVPFAVRVGIFRSNYSVMVVDDRTSLILDSGIGIGILLEMPQLAELLDSTLISERWDSSIPMNRYLEVVKYGLPDILMPPAGDYMLMDALKNMMLDDREGYSSIDIQRGLYERISDRILELTAMPLESAIGAWTAILKIALSDRGTVRYEPYTKMLTMEYEGGYSMPPSLWFMAFMGYLASKDIKPVIVHRGSTGNRTILQIKLPIRSQVVDESLNLVTKGV